MPKQKLQIVIIDDGKADIAVFQRYLSKDADFEYEIKFTSKGSEGIALIQQHRPDCVLLDYRLPDMTGFEVLEKIRQELQIHSVPIVMLTGSVDESLVLHALKRGAQDYLSKSTLSFENLLRAVHNAIEKIQVLRCLEETLQARDEFLSVASHELKTPLTSMTLQMQYGLLLLKRSEDGAIPRAEIHKILTRADTQLSHLSRLVSDLLDVSRISASRLEFNGEDLDLADMVSGVVERLSENFAAVGCKVSFRASGPVVGEFDRFRLEQVIVNLVSNAMKYAKGKPVHVEVFREKNWASILVRDEGPGISPAQQKNIFNRFDRGMAPKGTVGLGLGLYIAKQIVDLHQGMLSVHSVEGQGSTFTVKIPVRGVRG